MADLKDMITVERVPNGGAVVDVPEAYVEAWTTSGRWPCHGVTPETFRVEFDRIGNLVDLTSEQDGEAFAAIIGEAQAIAICEGALPEQLTMTPERLLAAISEVIEHRCEMISTQALEGAAQLIPVSAPSPH